MFKFHLKKNTTGASLADLKDGLPTPQQVWIYMMIGAAAIVGCLSVYSASVSFGLLINGENTSVSGGAKSYIDTGRLQKAVEIINQRK